MGNMSHCMFENTANDLEDCLEKMGNDFNFDNLSEYEQEGYKKLIELCVDVACDFGNCKEQD